MANYFNLQRQTLSPTKKPLLSAPSVNNQHAIYLVDRKHELHPAHAHQQIFSTPERKDFERNSYIRSNERESPPYNRPNPIFNSEKKLYDYNNFINRPKYDYQERLNQNSHEKSQREQIHKLHYFEKEKLELIRENKIIKQNSERNMKRLQEIIDIKDKIIYGLKQSNERYLSQLKEKEYQERKQSTVFNQFSPERKILAYRRQLFDEDETVKMSEIQNSPNKHNYLNDLKYKILNLENNIERLLWINQNFKRENEKLNEKNNLLEDDNNKLKQLYRKIDYHYETRGRLRLDESKKQMEDKLFQTMKEREKLERSIIDLEYKTSQLTEQIKINNSQIEKFENFLRKLRETVGVTRKIDDYAIILQKVKSKMDEANNKYESLNEKMPGLERVIEKLNKDLQEAHGNIEKFKEENKNLKENEKLCSDIRRLLGFPEKFKLNTNDFNKIKEELLLLKKKSEENKNLTASNKDFQNQIIKKKSKIEGLKSRIRSFESKFGRIEDNMQIKVGEIKSEANENKIRVEENMQREIEKFKGEAKVNEENLKSQFESNILKLKSQYTDIVNNLDNNLDKKAKEIETLNLQLLESKKELKKVKEELNKVKEELNRVKVVYKKSEEDLGDLKNEISVKENQFNNRIESLISKLQKKKESKAKLAQQLTVSLSDKKTAEESINKITNKLMSAKIERKKHENKSRELEIKLDLLEKEKIDIEKQHESSMLLEVMQDEYQLSIEVEKLKLEKKEYELNQENLKLKSQLKVLDEEWTIKLKTKCEDYNEKCKKLKELEEDFNMLKDEKFKLNVDVGKVESDKLKLLDQISGLNLSMTEKKSQLDSEIDSLKLQIDDLTSKLSSKNQENTMLQEENNVMKSKIKEIENKLDNLKSSHSSEINDLQQKHEKEFVEIKAKLKDKNEMKTPRDTEIVEELEADLKRAEILNDQIQFDKDTISKKILELEVLNQQILDDKNKLSGEKTRIFEELEKLKPYLNKIKHEHDQTLKNLSENQEKKDLEIKLFIEKLEEKLKVLENERDREFEENKNLKELLSKANSDAYQIESKISILVSKNEELIHENMGLQDELKNLNLVFEKKLKVIVDEKSYYKESFSKAEDELQNLKNSNSNLSNEVQKLKYHLSSEVEKSKVENESKNQKISLLERRNQELGATCSQMSKQTQDLQSNLKILSEQLGTKEEKIYELQKQYNSLENELIACKSQIAEKKQVPLVSGNNTSALEKEFSALKLRIGIFEKNNSDLSKSLSTKDSDLRNLKENLSKITEEYKVKEFQYEQTIKTLLESQGNRKILDEIEALSQQTENNQEDKKLLNQLIEENEKLRTEKAVGFEDYKAFKEMLEKTVDENKRLRLIIGSLRTFK